MRQALSSIVLLSAVAVISSGCGSMNGLIGSTDKFSCPDVSGVSCMSTREVYEAGHRNELPDQKRSRSKGESEARPPEKMSSLTPSGVTTQRLPEGAGMPLRTAPVVKRLWVAGWKDHDGDYHDQSNVYMTISNGDWVPEYNLPGSISYNTVKPRTSPGGAQSPSQTTPIRQTPKTPAAALLESVSQIQQQNTGDE